MFAEPMVWKRYWSCRSDYKKAKDRVKKTKSGSGAKACELTKNQKWKLANWAFIEPYIKPRRNPQGAEMGTVSICNNTDNVHSSPSAFLWMVLLSLLILASP